VSEGDLRDYYAQRANEYERVYAKPERQDDIVRLAAFLQDSLRDQDVLEVACGTGYWTAVTAQTARVVFATDINPEVIAVAQTKEYPPDKVHFQIADACTLEGVAGSFTAGFAGFWWSHLAHAQLSEFLDAFHRILGPDRLVVVADNRYVAGSNHPITRRDNEGNTYQLRTLDNGRSFEVLKNFPSEAELRASVGGLGRDVTVTMLTYYWCMTYRTTMN
jgi:demethylmenaquinone methyltransferase/2-methoxy-6-polyprenyl-1,4-benzoquinol methylase